ncbi:DUF4435 domain-containing protein [Methylocystis echinoides]|uniref:DUF4435 domain-containing protein n=1 Tax=Methylocystis echinoides TaxID=29468 RepID=UPI003433D0DB
MNVLVSTDWELAGSFDMPSGNEVIAKVDIPNPTGKFPLELKAGNSIVLAGANGAGKTRLGVFLEAACPADKVRRIAAHRSLVLSDKISAISLDRAMKGLQFGYIDGEAGHRTGHRWQNKPAVALLNDFEFLLQALFAETSRVAIQHLESRRTSPNEPPPETVLWRLKTIWERLLPHRKLRLQELGILVVPDAASTSDSTSEYPGSEMSDGERVIFYMLGQCLLIAPGSIIIVDEPELHIHKAILGRLWDAIEAERNDCSFVYITHDLDFLVSRPTATKLLVTAYSAEPRWQIESLPNDTGLPERVLSELVGSRQPILFVEGRRGSLDTTIYQSVFPHYTVEPIGPCEAVLHAVTSFRTNPSLHRVSAQGIVDADGRSEDQIAYLKGRGVFILPVAEVENLLLLPSVFKELALALHFSDLEAGDLLAKLTIAVMEEATKDLEKASVRFAVRKLDAELKKLAPAAKTIAELSQKFQASVQSLDPAALANDYKARLSTAIQSKELEKVLLLYDNKGLLSIAAQVLGYKSREELADLLSRLLARNDAPIKAAINAVLPTIA